MSTRAKNKRAVSVMIGYILLITFAVVISGFVYSWLKSYVPKQGIECPNDVSIYIKGYSIDGDKLDLVFLNNGKFDVGGIYIYYSDNDSQEIASKDLSSLIITGGDKMNPGLRFGSGDNSFKIGQEKIMTFDISHINYIHSIDIIPIRWQTKDNQIQVASCTKAKTTKILDENLGISGINTIQTTNTQDISSSSSPIENK